MRLVVSQYFAHNAGSLVVSSEWISPNFADFVPSLLENCLQHQGETRTGEKTPDSYNLTCICDFLWENILDNLFCNIIQNMPIFI